MTIRVCEAMNAPVGRLSDRTVCEANGGVLPRQVLIDADGCPVVDQNGLEYTADNIDALMLRRYENKKLLRAGKHPKGSPKRTKAQDAKFAGTLEKILSKNY